MSNIVENWENLKELIESLEADLNKTAGGNKAAGSRARKAIGEVKKLVTDYRKASVAGE